MYMYLKVYSLCVKRKCTNVTYTQNYVKLNNIVQIIHNIMWYYSSKSNSYVQVNYPTKLYS